MFLLIVYLLVLGWLSPSLSLLSRYSHIEALDKIIPRHHFLHAIEGDFQPTRSPRPPSFIDFNADKSFEGDMNAGLGSETLLYEDDDMVVYNKSTLTQTVPGFASHDSLVSRVQSKYGVERADQMVVHRLDYATSGVVVFALNVAALRSLHNQFREHHKMYKRYTAIVDGYMRTLEGEVDLPLGRDEERGPPLQCVRPDGKDSRTEWSVQGMKHGKTLVHLVPLTGRTHQLRVHMASLGHPILGDLFYAPKDVYYLSRRLLLHAEELHIWHPRLRYPMRFHAPCPFSLDNFENCRGLAS